MYIPREVLERSSYLIRSYGAYETVSRCYEVTGVAPIFSPDSSSDRNPSDKRTYKPNKPFRKLTARERWKKFGRSRGRTASGRKRYDKLGAVSAATPYARRIRALSIRGRLPSGGRQAAPPVRSGPPSASTRKRFLPCRRLHLISNYVRPDRIY